MLEEPPVRDVLAERHPVDLLEARHQFPGRRDATISLRKRDDDTVSVTPTKSVACKALASALSCPSIGVPSMSVPSDTTSSGHTTKEGARPPTRAAMSAVAANWAAVTVAGSTSDLRRPRTPPPWTDATRRV